MTMVLIPTVSSSPAMDDCSLERLVDLVPPLKPVPSILKRSEFAIGALPVV
ncbi:hypothetical protein D3C71_1778190 [compost metagenome]